jgi:hypothetical protein
VNLALAAVIALVAVVPLMALAIVVDRRLSRPVRQPVQWWTPPPPRRHARSRH